MTIIISHNVTSHPAPSTKAVLCCSCSFMTSTSNGLLSLFRGAKLPRCPTHTKSTSRTTLDNTTLGLMLQIRSRFMSIPNRQSPLRGSPGARGCAGCAKYLVPRLARRLSLSLTAGVPCERPVPPRPSTCAALEKNTTSLRAETTARSPNVTAVCVSNTLLSVFSVLSTGPLTRCHCVTRVRVWALLFILSCPSPPVTLETTVVVAK